MMTQMVELIEISRKVELVLTVEVPMIVEGLKVVLEEVAVMEVVVEEVVVM